MATSYKLYSATTTDGAAYVDLPVSGKITSVVISAAVWAGAGGIGILHPELSRQAVNQTTTNNPRGVLAQLMLATPAASQGVTAAQKFDLNEPVRSGERIYLNCAGGASNIAGNAIVAIITVG